MHIWIHGNFIRSGKTSPSRSPQGDRPSIQSQAHSLQRRVRTTSLNKFRGGTILVQAGSFASFVGGPSLIHWIHPHVCVQAFEKECYQ